MGHRNCPEPSSEWAGPPEAPGGASPRRSGSILVVDDDPLVRDCTADILDAEGYHVVPLANGAQAVEYHQQHAAEVALVLMDVCMPGLSGPEAYDRMRQTDPDLPLVLISGYRAEGLFIDEVGGDLRGFLPKPFRVDGLLQAVRNALQPR